MKNNTLVIGGCRSGKSSYALKAANKIPGNKKLFIATSVPTDPEMEKRVTSHKEERGSDWETSETPVHIADTIKKLSPSYDVILVDCLTLWVSNLMMDRFTQNDILDITKKLIQSLNNAPCPVILVSNEVGTGIVPENQLSRQFRDFAGLVNQKVAAGVDTVVWTVAGIPVTIKKRGQVCP